MTGDVNVPLVHRLTATADSSAVFETTELGSKNIKTKAQFLMSDWSKVPNVCSRSTGVYFRLIHNIRTDAGAPTELRLLQSNPRVAGKVP